jgi:Holliday junction resolvase RusA-like endonuclease
MVYSVEFFVPGLPVPQGSVKAFGGHIVSTTNALDKWRALVRAGGVDALGDHPVLDGPLGISTVFLLPLVQRPRWQRPAVKPDGDKLTRAVWDALTVVPERMTRSKKRPKLIPAQPGMVTNDSRFVQWMGSKRYSPNPGVIIKVWEVAE